MYRLYGCYENIGGPGSSTTRALQDLIGGIVQSFGLSNQDRFLTYQVLNSAVPRSSLLISTITLVSTFNRFLSNVLLYCVRKIVHFIECNTSFCVFFRNIHVVNFFLTFQNRCRFFIQRCICSSHLTAVIILSAFIFEYSHDSQTRSVHL